MRRSYFILLLFSLGASSLRAQEGARYDDEFYACSFWAPVEMTRSYNYSVDTNARYTVYAGGHVDGLDTMYFRVDMWRQFYLDSLLEAPGHMGAWVMDSTLALVTQRMGAPYLYRHDDRHRDYPKTLARYELPSGKIVKVNLVRREEDFFLFTVVTLGDSHRHDWVNIFLSGYIIE